MTAETPDKTFDFAALIAQVSPEEFLRAHWENKPLHLARDDPRYHERLLTNEDLESIISAADLRYPAIQIARNGSYLPAEAYTRNIKHGGEFFNGVPDLGRIQTEYRTGSTIVLPALHRTWPPLRDLCALLENEFGHAAHANAYLTPGNSTGFTPHYDTHEVFVLQIAGAKKWRVFEPPLPLPHRTQPFTPTGYALPAPLFELELKPGDMLYLPRGYVHAASTSDSHSAHITIGMTVYTWVELLSELIAASTNIADFRSALPPGFARRDELRRNLKEGLIQGLDRLRQNSDADRLIDAFLRKVRSGHARPAAAFQADVKVIGLRTLLKAPQPGRCRVATENGAAILEFDGRTLVLPGHVRATLDDMCKRPSFRPEELAGPLDNDAKLGLARYLHGERFLTLAD